MKEKITNLIISYKSSLERKERLLQPYIDKKNDDDLFEPKWNIIDEENYSKLKAETEMLKRHIDDLEWIIKK
jgi:cell division protein FtsB